MGFFDGALGAAASIFGGIMGAESQSSTNAMTEEMFNKNLDFQREMRDTQYQAAVKDMSAAGLNPMLAYKNGGNTASGGSGIPQLTAPYGAGMQSAVNSAVVAKTYADAEAAKATAANQKAQADVTASLGAIKAQAEIENLKSSATSSLSSADVNRKTLDVMNYQMDKLFSETSLNMSQQDLVRKQAANAILTGKNIEANTGNLEVDSALKKVQSLYWQTQADLNKQQINFNVLDLPHRISESNFWSSKYGMELAPYVNSASKAGLIDIPKAEVLRGYHSK